MTYYGSKELAASFRTVRGNTIQIANEIPEESYDFRPAPDSRSVGETLVHIAMATRIPTQIHFVERRTALEGFDYMGHFAKVVAEEKTPRTKVQTIALLTSSGEEYANHLEGCTEEFLSHVLSFPTPAGISSKTRFEMLLGVKEHEMHHRAQLMVVERMLGMTPHLTRQMDERIERMKAARAGS